MICHSNTILNDVKPYLKLDKIISKYDAMFIFDVKSDIFQFVYFCRHFVLERLSQTQLLSHVSNSAKGSEVTAQFYKKNDVVKKD